MSERERSGERKKRSKGQNSSRVERARIPESHRPMHLYPARLGSALPASVARQSSPPLSLFLSFPSSPALPVLYQVLLLRSSRLFRSLQRHEIALRTFGKEGGGGGEAGGGRSTFLPKETRACRALLFPTLLYSRQSSTQPKKIRYTRQKYILGFRYA